MVGFGSSLRMARRAGWERAYLDYETLKMLLSQIEAVYEEEWHRQSAEGEVFEERRPRGRKRRKPGVNDYRDELFLESDSDLAFASSASDLLGGHDSEDTDEERGQAVDACSTGPAGHKPFTLSYSQENDSTDADEDSPDLDDNCGRRSLTLGWRRESKTTVLEEATAKKPRKKQKRRMMVSPGREQSDFFVGGHDEFLVEGSEASGGTSALLNTSFQRGFTDENSALLQQPQLEERGTFYSFDNRKETMTPPHDFSGGAYYPSNALTPSIKNQPPVLPRLTPSEMKRGKLDAERRRKRRQRRRKKAAKRQRELERRVPQHLRVAHAKARSITERFLGLLRAEVEKVTLFAQSRLGELADTAGSLRFPSYDDSEYGSFSSRHGRRGGAYEHPLSDGGMHPSASSSEEEQAGNSIFPWSDTSDEDENSETGSQRATSPGFGRGGRKKLSVGSLSTATRQTANKAGNTKESETDEMALRGAPKTTKAKNTSFDAAKRQISHFTALRCQRPTFQRNDNIVGEDLLLLSAVDEADGYTAVGVELMHVLRFICVNVIAVRKICRKHDRLLMNRMLGGYYHRKRKRTKKGKDGSKGEGGDSQQFLTLGNIVAHSLGEVSEVDPAAVAGLNHKLVGVYDLKVQELANSPTVKVVSSCLALALSEYEVSQSRADALSKLNSVASTAETPQRTGASGGFVASLIPSGTAAFGLSPSRWMAGIKTNKKLEVIEAANDSDDDSEADAGPPSTASSISLTRLRFTVVSIFALRENARFKLDFHDIFLSRSLLVFSGPNIVGEGLDGCSREVLDFFIAYNPDAALLLDSSALYEGLQEGKWRTIPIGRIMLSSLSLAVTSPLYGVEMGIQDAVSIKPSLSVEMVRPSIGADSDFNQALLSLSRRSCLLNSMNYYIVHATANTFVRFTGAHPAYSANIIGATSFAALFATIFQCYQLSKDPIGEDLSIARLRTSFLLAASAGIVGNAVYVAGISLESILLTVVGRLLIGFASTDILHQQILVNCVPAVYVVPESALLVNSRVHGRALGLLVGAVLGSINVTFFGPHFLSFGAFEWAGYLMSFLWIVQGLRLFFVLPAPVRVGESEKEGGLNGVPDTWDGTQSQSEDFSSDESEHEAQTPESALFASSSDVTGDELEATYSAAEHALMGTRVAKDANDSASKESNFARRTLHGLKTLMKRLRKFVLCNVALPVTLALVVMATFTHEIFFTSCAVITYRYFHWSGNLSAIFLCMLSASVLLINYVCGVLTKTYDERTVIKRSIGFVGAGLLIMINYASMFQLAGQVENLLEETAETDEATYIEVHPYDWVFGVYQYVIGLMVLFAGIMALEGSSLSLMSKVAPPKFKSVVINCGTIVTFSSLAARVLGDIQILFVGLSHRVINTDIVNSLVVPLLIAFGAAYYVVKKHFFFLM